MSKRTVTIPLDEYEKIQEENESLKKEVACLKGKYNRCRNELSTVGGWIPVSDKLPAELEPVNITWINRDPEPYYVEIKDTPFTATAVYRKGKWWWYSVDNAIEILAWQPIPEPYKKEGAENDKNDE